VSAVTTNESASPNGASDPVCGLTYPTFSIFVATAAGCELAAELAPDAAELAPDVAELAPVAAELAPVAEELAATLLFLLLLQASSRVGDAIAAAARPPIFRNDRRSNRLASNEGDMFLLLV
jgi:hypothetical protein